MVHTIAEQTRSLLVAWLLLTLPVICHHETAVMVLGALTAGHAHPHHAAGPTSHHASHMATSDAHATAPLATYQRQPSSSQHQWCANHSVQHSHGLPEGQDGVGFVRALPWWGTDQPIDRGVRLQPSPPDSASTRPPSPPPRVLA